MKRNSKKWLGVVVILFALFFAVWAYPLVSVLAPSSTHLEVTSDLDAVTAGAPVDLRFHVVDKAGVVVKEFEIAHEKLLHLVLVRNDLQGFQHVHPELNAETGEFSLMVTFPEAGTYTLFADFVPQHEDREVLSFPATVNGEYSAVPLENSSGEAIAVGGFMVTPTFPTSIMMGDPVAYSFEVTRDGEPVSLESYLGALGHSAVLHEGDLAYIHTHADAETLSFQTVFEQTGTYKAFTEFQVEGVVYEVDFVFEVGSGEGSASMDMSNH